MSKVVKVTYNAETLLTEITVDGQSFDTSRINGKEIADWAYPFMMRKVRWNGFYDEMVEALGGENEFDLVFEGSEEDLNELKEAWEDAPVTIISGENVGNTVVIEYDENSLTTDITVNGHPFDTSRINGKEIDDWVYPFMMRKVKWDGIFEELAKAVGSEDYTIQFSGSNSAMKELMEDCPESVEILQGRNKENKSNNMKAKADSDNDELKKAEDLYISSKTKEAFPIFEKLAQNGNGRAMYLLSNYYIGLLGIPRDIEKRTYWLNKGAESGDLLSKLTIAKSISEYGSKDNADRKWKIFDEVFPALSKMAEDGDVISQCEITPLLFGYYGKYRKHENFSLGIEYLKNASEKYGFAKAQYELGNCYKGGRGVDRNLDIAIEYYTKATNQNYLPSMYALGSLYKVFGENKEDEQNQFAWFIRAAENGHPGAFDEVAECYYYGIGVEKNYNEAFIWAKRADSDMLLGKMYYFGHGTEENFYEAVKHFEKAAEWDSEAMVFLGDCYYSGHGVTQNYVEAVRWYKEAVEENEIYAMYDLAVCYYYGEGVEQDYTEAVKWYRIAAEQGHKYAQNSLGDCYCFGEGVEQNDEEAVEWYTKAAEQGMTDAQCKLGYCYSNGIGTNQDYQKAFELYSQVYDEEGTERFIENLNSAEEDIYSSESSNMKKEYAFNFLMSHSLFDDPTIHFLLGKCFDEGIGTVQNYKEAVNWYTKAAEQDNAKACNNLGNCYLHGNGVKKDRAKAMELFKKAKDLGSEAGKNNYNLQKTKDVAGKLGKGVLGVLGTVGSAYAQSYAQSVLDDDDE